MNKQSREALDAYYAEADSWAQDRRAALGRSRRIAWWVAGAAAVIAILEAVALVVLTPLKTVEPYTLLVDRQTGFVQALKPIDPQLVASDTALTQSFLVQYVIAREGYDINSLQADYRRVALWSGGEARQRYLASMQTTSADSPLALYPRSAVVDVMIKSVTPMSNNVAMVRFNTQRRDAGGQVRPDRQWVAVIRYSFTGAPMTVADRLINPLGFQVTRYRRSAEMLAAPEPVSVPRPEYPLPYPQAASPASASRLSSSTTAPMTQQP